MKSRIIGQLCLAFVFLIQTLWMSGSAAAFAANDDTRLLICNPSGQVNSAIFAANEKLLIALGLKEKTPDDVHDEKCAFCAISHALIFTQLRIQDALHFGIYIEKSNIYEPAFVYLPQGPPLGGRAPPNYI